MGEREFWSTSSSSPFRFLDNNLKQPDPFPDPFELNESDVVWSSPSPSLPPISSSPQPPHLHHPLPLISSSPPPPHLHLHHPLPQSRFNPSNSGLSAALSDDTLHPLLRRKSNLNPFLSLSATKPIPQSESRQQSKFHQSAPMDVPAWPYKIGEMKRNGNNYLDHFDEVEDEVDGDDEMVPPHVIVARSHVTFSVFEGVGRTLKGRDLRRVRNAVFQKTGFID